MEHFFLPCAAGADQLEHGADVGGATLIGRSIKVAGFVEDHGRVLWVGPVGHASNEHMELNFGVDATGKLQLEGCAKSGAAALSRPVEISLGVGNQPRVGIISVAAEGVEVVEQLFGS